MLEIPHEHLRLRIEQELRNMLLRLRRLGIDAIADPQLLARSLTRTARPLAIELDALRRLSQASSTPPEDRVHPSFSKPPRLRSDLERSGTGVWLS